MRQKRNSHCKKQEKSYKIEDESENNEEVSPQISDGTLLDVYTYEYDSANNQISKHEIISQGVRGLQFSFNLTECKKYLGGENEY